MQRLLRSSPPHAQHRQIMHQAEEFSCNEGLVRKLHSFKKIPFKDNIRMGFMIKKVLGVGFLWILLVVFY